VLEPDLPPRAPGEWLVRDGGGYRLKVDADSADVLRFRLLATRAREAGARAEAVRLFVEALELWRGPCATGLRAVVNPNFAAVDQECLATAAEAADVALRCGLAKDVLPLLRKIAPHDPLNEGLHARLVLLLSATGHPAEALAVHRSLTERLADELGIDPGPELRAAHQQVLHPETRPEPESVPSTAGPGRAPVHPAQLPRDLPTFTGRNADLARMLSSMRSADRPMTLALIDGMPGAGKTTVAVRLAYEAAERFPDGQLFVNLRGFDPGGSVMEPAEALRGFLYALGTPSSHVPNDLDAQTGLYRSLLKDKRMLVVLDNARDVDHVLPLIPSSPHCLAIVTSRNRLTGLVAVEGAHPFTLDPMPVADARAMVRLRLGFERGEREPEAVDEIVALCARLPLALAIVAARAAIHPDVPLSAIARELRDAQGSLDAFSYDDVTDLRAVFSWSYRTLSPQAARLFRLLALHWGPDISLAAAASALGVPVKAARTGLAELTRTRLMTEHEPGRFSFHDLVRAYAIELGDEVDSESDRHEALARMADHYLHSAHHVHRPLRPHQKPVPLGPARSGVTPESISEYDRAIAWFTAEQEVLQDFVAKAAELGFADHAWQVALSMQEFLQSQGLHLSWAAVMPAALAAARESGDRNGEARTLRSLAGAYYFTGEHDLAIEHLLRTDELLDELGWDSEKAYVQRNIADVLARRSLNSGGDYVRARVHYERALELYQRMNHRQGVAIALEGIAVCALRLEQTDTAIGLLDRAMAEFRDIDDVSGQARCWSESGECHYALGKHAEAAACFRQAAELHGTQAHWMGEFECLVLLGDALAAAGDDGAQAAWADAVALLDRREVSWVGPPVYSLDDVEERIARLGQA
jgi:tetratricopeptide (TPR) repeat protein